MRTRDLTAAVLATSLALALTGCSTAPNQTASASPTSPAPSASSAPSSPADTQAFLARNGLAGKDVKTIVSELDRTQDDKAKGLKGSVRQGELQLTDASGATAAVPIPADSFYLSMAPYVSRTHECFYHHLTGCQGELADKAMQVTITDAAGKTLVDEQVRTYANGFVGFWLPRDVTGTITVVYDGKTVKAPFATGATSPTCVATLQLA
ncbi:CueP family metal-binding protein [Arsenicicoccus cauae]|uniref:CueP family metal-binding protein n=1 Tax=Arsenicicoccus cauae TaxID=2663847 RepID=A0A6I3IWA3_9MICO|nr:CueP family metal-binding protein [Arsenicicoccus cauae]MTB71146.1 hypothetical protein [Arsenicicoccus cauae]